MRFRIVARKSPLALAQAGAVAAALSRARPGIETEIRGVSTRGDEITDRPLAEVGGKELFVKGLQGELLAGRGDCAVHSLKDMAAVSEGGFRWRRLVLRRMRGTRRFAAKGRRWGNCGTGRGWGLPARGGRRC